MDSNVPRGTMKIRLFQRGMQSDLLEPTKDGKRLGHKREVSRARVNQCLDYKQGLEGIGGFHRGMGAHGVK